MNLVSEIVTDTGYLVHVAMLGYVAGFLFRDQIILRLLVLVGTVFYITYYYLHPAEPLWGAIYASLAIMTANAIGLIRLLYSRLPIGIPAEQWPIFEALSGLEPGEFRQLMRLGDMRRAEAQTILTEEGAPVEKLYFVISGGVTGEKDGVGFPVPVGEFIGDVSFMLKAEATASITMGAGGFYYEWLKSDLSAALDRQPKLAHAFEALIGRGMARKFGDSRRTHPVATPAAA